MTATCGICGGATRDGLPCRACMAQISRDLNAIPELLHELDLAASKQTALTPPARGGLASERNPVGWPATEAARDLTATLTRWTRTITNRPTYYATTAAHRLLARTDLIRTHPDAPAFADDLARVTSQARARIDRPDDRPTVGACPTWLEDHECGGPLHLDADTGTVTCARCRRTFDRTELRHLGEMLTHSGPVDIHRAEWATDVPASTIRRWIAERRFTATKTGGKLLVLVTDVKAARDGQRPPNSTQVDEPGREQFTAVK